jgi:hypothetical protein
VGNSRLGAGLGAAGLASGFAASHFGRVGWVGELEVVERVRGLEALVVVRYVGVECRDDGLLAAVGGRGGLIRTGKRVVVRARSTWATSAGLAAAAG